MPRKPHIPNPRSEQGMTLIETVVAAAMAVVLTGATVAMFVTVLQQQPDLTDRADQVGKARIAVERMVREIRQGVAGSVSTATSTRLEFKTYVDGSCGTTAVTTGTKCSVLYICESAKCTRTTGTSPATATTTIVENVKNAAVFSYLTGPSQCGGVTGEGKTFVEVTIELRSDKAGVTKLQDGAGLRSCA